MDSKKISVELRYSLFRAGFFDGPSHSVSGTVDDNIQPPMLTIDMLHALPHRAFIGHIHAQGGKGPTIARLQAATGSIDSHSFAGQVFSTNLSNPG
jgi:hypothetical protein